MDTVSHQLRDVLHDICLPIHSGDKPKHAAGVFVAWYRPAQPGQIATPQIDEQPDNAALKILELRCVAKSAAKRLQEVAQFVVALYNRFKHGFSGSGLRFVA